tara:strand:+ start:2122 stop:3222 length:1101 start_codon:yes stop_codon:yes gene_type:complete
MSWIKKTILFLFVVTLSLGLLEFGSRSILGVFEKSGINISGRMAVDSLINGKNFRNSEALLVPNPYSLYWNNPNFLDADFGKQYDKYGYRSDEADISNKDLVKILVLGGSTTNMWPYIKDKNKIWTSLLEQKLEQYLNKNIVIINAGLPYGTSAEALAHYSMNAKYLKPNITIYHGGGNDTMPLLFPNYKTDYSHVRWSTTGLMLRPQFKVILEKSYFLKLLYSVIFTGNVYNGSPDFQGLNLNEVDKRVLNTESQAFRGNINMLAAENTRLGALTVFVGFLQAKKENLTKNRPDLIGLENSLILGAEKHDVIMKDISEYNSNVSFLKLDQSKFEDDWFQDNCHLNEAGEVEKAKQIFEFIKPLLE